MPDSKGSFLLRPQALLPSRAGDAHIEGAQAEDAEQEDGETPVVGDESCQSGMLNLLTERLVSSLKRMRAVTVAAKSIALILWVTRSK